MIHRLLVVVAVLVLLPGSFAARAGAQSTDKNPLASVKSLKCRFPVYTRRIVEERRGEGGSEAGAAVQPRDRRDRRGRRHRSGHRHVRSDARHGAADDQQSAFRGTNRDGNADDHHGVCVGRQRRKFRAVHSRHDYLPMSLPGYVSEPSVSQNYGECEVPAAAASPAESAGRRESRCAQSVIWRIQTVSRLAAQPDRKILQNPLPFDPNPP